MHNHSWYILFITPFFNSFTEGHLPREMIHELHRINALTMRAVAQPPRGIMATSIEQLVRTIYLQNSVPHHTLLLIDKRYFMVHRGIEIGPADTHIFIFSRGYAKATTPGTNDDFIQRGAAAKAAYIQLENKIIPHQYPLISFDYDDGREGFAFGQSKEINILQTVFDAVVDKNPAAAITLMGDCRGGKVALEVATRKPKNLHSLILMAPFISSREITDNIALHHLSYLPYSRAILHQFFKVYFKNYREDADTLRQRLSLIDPQLPIFIAHRMNDQLVSTSTIQRLVDELRQAGNKNVQVLISQDASEPHSKLTVIDEIKHGIAQFMQRYGIVSSSSN